MASLDGAVKGGTVRANTRTRHWHERTRARAARERAVVVRTVMCEELLRSEADLIANVADAIAVDEYREAFAEGAELTMREAAAFVRGQ